MALPRKQKPSPAEGEFLFQLDPEPLEECVTAYGGIPLFLQAARSLDVPGRVKQHLQLKQRQRGLDEAGYVESFLVLNALGGECLDDFDRLREDEGLREMMGHDVPSPEAARKFLYQFHDESKRNIGVGDLNSPLDVSYLPVIALQNKTTLEIKTTTDPGRALISGLWKDVGRLKGLILRGLASRAPYFHNGSANSLGDAIDFYNKRFNVGITAQEKNDLIAFLSTL